VEQVTEVELRSCRCALAEQTLLATATGGMEGAADRQVCTMPSQCALLHAQLLHATLQYERIPTLQCDAETEERIEEEGLGRQLAASTGQLVQEGTGCESYSAVALHSEGHQCEAAMLAQRLIARALLRSALSKTCGEDKGMRNSKISGNIFLNIVETS
jgi:hypothetical protein